MSKIEIRGTKSRSRWLSQPGSAPSTVGSYLPDASFWVSAEREDNSAVRLAFDLAEAALVHKHLGQFLERAEGIEHIKTALKAGHTIGCRTVTDGSNYACTCGAA